MKRIATIFLLALGVTAHDIASIEGFHIPGLHAIYFSIPIGLICFFILTERWLKERWKRRHCWRCRMPKAWCVCKIEKCVPECAISPCCFECPPDTNTHLHRCRSDHNLQ